MAYRLNGWPEIIYLPRCLLLNWEKSIPMKTHHGIIKGIVLVGLVLVCVLVASCVSERQYRTDAQVQQFNPKTSKDSHAIIEVAPLYTAGYVELDDQGWLYGDGGRNARMQIDTVTNQFTKEGQSNGLLIVTFVHGWKHNASGNDSYVAMFHKILNELGKMEQVLSTKQHHPQRRVVGLYIGWRGLSENIQPFEDLSFWGRKDAAERVGHGAVIEVLSELEAFRNQLNQKFHDEITNHRRMNTKLIIMGHSFGGDVVYSAAAPVLTERMVENYDQDGLPQPPKSLGDLVVLINPAFEAARFETLNRLASTKSFPLSTNCTLAVFTSRADWATGLAFPVGRSVSTLFDQYEDSHQRQANLAAVGHYAPYLNYELKPFNKNLKSPEMTSATNDVSPSTSADSVLSVRSKIQQRRQRGEPTNDLAYVFTRCQLLPTTNCIPNDPVFNVAVDPAIIPDHDTIDRWVFIRFLAEFMFAFSSNGEK
jgi:hypothetical protein